MSKVNAQKCQVIPYFGKTDCDQPSWPGLFITMPFSDQPLSSPMCPSFLQRLGSPSSSPQRGLGSCPPMQRSSSPQAGGGIHPREAQGGSQACLCCPAQSRVGRVSWCLLAPWAHLGMVPRGGTFTGAWTLGGTAACTASAGVSCGPLALSCLHLPTGLHSHWGGVLVRCLA